MRPALKKGNTKAAIEVNTRLLMQRGMTETKAKKTAKEYASETAREVEAGKRRRGSTHA